MKRRTLFKFGGALLAVPCLGNIGLARAKTQVTLYDTHRHLMSDNLKRYPRQGVSLGGGSAPPPKDVGPNSKGGVASTLPGDYFGNIKPLPRLGDVVRWMAENNVDAAVAVQKKGTYGYDNSYVLDASDVASDKFTAVAVVDPKADETPAEVLRLAREHNCAGIRLTGLQGPKSDYGWLLSDKALKVWQAAHEAEMTVDLMAVEPGYDATTCQHYRDLAQRFSQVRLVLNHLAWPDLTQANFGLSDELKRLTSLDNVFFKFTTININMLSEARVEASSFLRAAVDTLGADRLMWGSDIGNSAGTYAELVGRMLAACSGLNASEQELVLSDAGRAAYRRHA